MGIFSAIYSLSGANVEFAVLDLLDLTAQRTTSPGLDDVMGTPFLAPTASGVGQRVRPTKTVTIRGKLSTWPQQGEQTLDQVFDDPQSKLALTLYDWDLFSAGLLVDGQCILKPDDRLLRMLYSDGIQAPAQAPATQASEAQSPVDLQSAAQVRFDFTVGNQPGLRCYAVRPGLTGTRCWYMLFEHQGASQSAYGPG